MQLITPLYSELDSYLKTQNLVVLNVNNLQYANVVLKVDPLINFRQNLAAVMNSHIKVQTNLQISVQCQLALIELAFMTQTFRNFPQNRITQNSDLYSYMQQINVYVPSQMVQYIQRIADFKTQYGDFVVQQPYSIFMHSFSRFQTFMEQMFESERVNNETQGITLVSKWAQFKPQSDGKQLFIYENYHSGKQIGFSPIAIFEAPIYYSKDDVGLRQMKVDIEIFWEKFFIQWKWSQCDKLRFLFKAKPLNKYSSYSVVEQTLDGLVNIELLDNAITIIIKVLCKVYFNVNSIGELTENDIQNFKQQPFNMHVIDQTETKKILYALQTQLKYLLKYGPLFENKNKEFVRVNEIKSYQGHGDQSLCVTYYFDDESLRMKFASPLLLSQKSFCRSSFFKSTAQILLTDVVYEINHSFNQRGLEDYMSRGIRGFKDPD